jgi:outer membrane protein assembly factor BamD
LAAAITTVRIRAALLVLAAVLAGACGSKGPQSVDPTADAREYFEKGERAVNIGNYGSAISYLEYLRAVYPFSEYAKQAQLDLMYAYYRNGQDESAIETADQFLLENPTHPRVDYAHYIKGLVNFERKRGPLERLFRSDLSKRPQASLEDAYRSFSVVATQYPDSPYAADSRQRMVYLRNQLARFEIHVADYYMRRGAFVAAANRARFVLETYQESPSVVQALQILVSAYRQLELEELAADSMRVLEENYPEQAFAYGARGTKPQGTLIERFILRRSLK